MSDDDDEGPPQDEEKVRDALRGLKSGEEAELGQVLCLIAASLEREVELVPKALIDAVLAKWETDGDYANGGADQFAWNQGAEAARAVAAAWREVGAIENADLLDRLAGEVAAYCAEHGDAIAGDPVHHFLAYRKRVNGPFFGIPEPGEELAEALVEYAVEHVDALPDPDGPLPGFDGSKPDP